VAVAEMSCSQSGRPVGESESRQGVMDGVRGVSTEGLFRCLGVCSCKNPFCEHWSGSDDVFCLVRVRCSDVGSDHRQDCKLCDFVVDWNVQLSRCWIVGSLGRSEDSKCREVLSGSVVEPRLCPELGLRCAGSDESGGDSAAITNTVGSGAVSEEAAESVVSLFRVGGSDLCAQFLEDVEDLAPGEGAIGREESDGCSSDDGDEVSDDLVKACKACKAMSLGGLL
jgi:hypothetical protein